MAKRLAVVLGMLLIALVTGPAPVAKAAPDPYQPKAPTDCGIRIPAKVNKGNRVIVRVSVKANSTVKPTGTVTVRLFRQSSGIALARAGEIWSTSRHYSGTPLTIRGPVLDEVGRYRVTTHFEADDPTLFKDCRDSATFTVEVKSTDRDRDDDDNDGLLPNTGGPYFWLLLLGLGLVAGGTGTVIYARRRQHEHGHAPVTAT